MNNIYRCLSLSPIGISKQQIEKKGYLKIEKQKCDLNYIWLYKQIDHEPLQHEEIHKMHLNGFVPLTHFFNTDKKQHFSCIIKHSKHDIKRLNKSGLHYSPCDTNGFYIVSYASKSGLEEIISKNKFSQVSDIDDI